jgi:hypothetical protein
MQKLVLSSACTQSSLLHGMQGAGDKQARGLAYRMSCMCAPAAGLPGGDLAGYKVYAYYDVQCVLML